MQRVWYGMGGDVGGRCDRYGSDGTGAMMSFFPSQPREVFPASRCQSGLSINQSINQSMHGMAWMEKSTVSYRYS